MSDRKTGDNETAVVREAVVLHNRRMEEVRRNFAVGIQRIVTERVMNRERNMKEGRRDTA